MLERAFPSDEAGNSSFNVAIMTLLPKNELLTTELGVAYTHAEDLRPLSIVNTDNRLMANAVR